MRTTVSINDDLLAAAKALARHRGYTLGQLLEDALRRELRGRPDATRPEVPVFQGGSGPRPGVDLRSNRALTEFLDPAEAALAGGSAPRILPASGRSSRSAP